MQTYISMLRGINVSGRNMIKMDALRTIYESLNFKNIKSYIQSGNVIFNTKPSKPKDLEKKIMTQIKKEFNFDIPVIVKETEELKTVFNNNPFLTKRKEDITKLHVTFLSQEPEEIDIKKIKEGNYSEDEFIFIDKVVYLFCPNGYGNTKLTNTFFENKLKVTATTRNWKTVTELVNIAE
jgi:uncharacterized protein (DUF1697 family)